MDIWNELTDSFNKEMAIDEMRKKYENTYLVIQTPSNTEVIARYDGYHDNYHIFKDNHGMTIKLAHNTEYKVICKFPERCLFNYNKVAYEFIRKPARQYKRGVCKDNAQIYSPVRSLWGGEQYISWDGKILESALYPKYPNSCEEVIKQLQAKEVLGIALNPKFMVSLSITNDKNILHLFYCNVLIGFFDKDTFHIKHKLFTQEVLDNIHLFKPYRIEL